MFPLQTRGSGSASGTAAGPIRQARGMGSQGTSALPPFLLRALPRSTVVPLLVGEADPAGIDVPLEAPWDGPESAIAG